MNDDPSPTLETREEFLTARQLASILQVSEATVRRLARKGRIPSIRLTPRIMRFHLQAVRDALDGRPRSRRNAAETQLEDPQLSFMDLL
jgi:excisionase family DNA binding protein